MTSDSADRAPIDLDRAAHEHAAALRAGEYTARALAEATLAVPISRIGVVERRPGLRCLDPDGFTRPVPAGYEHFASGGGSAATAES